MGNVHDGVMVRRLEGHTVLFITGTYVTDLTLPGLFRVDLDTRLPKTDPPGRSADGTLAR